MKLQNRISVNLSLFFSILHVIISLIIYWQFSLFRKEEFAYLLNEKAATSLKLITEVKESEKQLLKLIDQNTINKLFDEKTLIFNDSSKLIYSSVDDAVIDWSLADLRYLKSHRTFYRHQDKYDVFGIYYKSPKANYYLLTSAEDVYGNRKLEYLKFLLIATLLVGVTVMWITSLYFVRSVISPLNIFQKKITTITERNLTERFEETENKDEINLMAKAFNQMMLRIQNSYKKQQEFTANASHELRTPIARIITQLENLQIIASHSPQTAEYLVSIKNDANQMADLITSLLLLSKVEENSEVHFLEVRRIDEILFDAISLVKKQFSDFQVSFSINEDDDSDLNLEIPCNESLLKIVFINLLKNSYFYSDNQSASIEIIPLEDGQLVVRITNSGCIIAESEQHLLFQPFMRGRNAQSKPGTGLGLRIAQRILAHHKAQITYLALNDKTNVFDVIFPL